MIVGIIDPSLLPETWHKCEALVSEACEHNGLETSANIYKKLEEKKQQLWLAVENHEVFGLAVTSIETHPLKKICSVDICTGHDMALWIDGLKKIEDWARSIGCAEMICAARLGWARKLKDYRITHAIIQKVL